WEWRYVRRLCDSALLVLEGHTAPVRWVAFSPDGRRLASTAGGWGMNGPGEVRLWDAGTGQLLWAGATPTSPALAAAFSPDGRELAVASRSSAATAADITLYDTATGQVTRTFADAARGAFGLACSPDGRWLAAAGIDSTVRLWDRATGKPAAVFSG